MATFIKIATVSLPSGSGASLDFSDIPQTYTDLKLVFSGNGTIIWSGLSVRFNGSSTNYLGKYLRGNGAAAQSYTQAAFGTTAIWGTYFDSSVVTPTNQEFYIPNYTSSNAKSVSVDTVQEGNSATSYSFISAQLWDNHAAITSISVFPESGLLTRYSSATLYGIKSS